MQLSFVEVDWNQKCSCFFLCFLSHDTCYVTFIFYIESSVFYFDKKKSEWPQRWNLFWGSETVFATRGPNFTNVELDGNCDWKMLELGLENICFYYLFSVLFLIYLYKLPYRKYFLHSLYMDWVIHTYAHLLSNVTINWQTQVNIIK